MQNCSQHPETQAAWECSRCGKSLCELCASGEQKPGLPTVMCAHCGGIAKVIRKPKDIRKYWQMFPDFIGALFGWKGLLQLAAVALIMQVAMFFGCLGAIIGWGLYAGYYFLVLKTASVGEVSLPKPGDFSSPFDDILMPLVRLILALVLPAIPPIAYLALRSSLVVPEDPALFFADPILVVIVLACLSYVPGALIIAAVNESVGAQLNPLNVIGIITRIPGEYFVTVLVWIALQGANLALSVGMESLAGIVPIPIVMPIVARFVGLFVPMLTAMILGRLIYQNAAKFGLLLTKDEMEPVRPMAVPKRRPSQDAFESSTIPGMSIPAAERSAAPWESPPSSRSMASAPASGPVMPRAAEASVAPWEQPPAGAGMPTQAEESVPLDDAGAGPRSSLLDEPPVGPVAGQDPFAQAEESIPLDDDHAGPRGVRPGMGGPPPAAGGPQVDPFAQAEESVPLDDSDGPRGFQPGVTDRARARFDDTPEPIPIVDMPAPPEAGMSGALHVGPGGTMDGRPVDSRDPDDGTPVDHQPPAEDFAPPTLGGELPPSAEASDGDAAAISVNLDAGALDNPLRMALEGNDAHSALMNFRELTAIGQQPDLPPELELRLATMLEQAGQFGDAVMACKRCSEKDPSGPHAATATFFGARVLVERMNNPEQGQALLQYLLRHYPEDSVAEQARLLLAKLQQG